MHQVQVPLDLVLDLGGLETGRFRKSWNLQFIEATAKGAKYAYCNFAGFRDC